jgi:hypothetical protein
MRWPLDQLQRGALCAAGLVLAACSSEATGSRSSTLCAGPAALTYEDFGRPFFLSWCTGCHASDLPESARRGAPVGLNFDDLTSVRAHRERIRERAVTARTMPPAGGPSDAQREQLAAWLECGAPGHMHDFDAGPSVPVFTPPAGQCGAPREALPAVLLPRCSHETYLCVQQCMGDAKVDACRNACLAADTTPAAFLGGYPVNCSICTTLQLLACGEHTDCHDPIASALCCNDQKCPNGSPQGCLDQKCPSESRALGLCLGYAAQACLDFSTNELSSCFAQQ